MELPPYRIPTLRSVVIHIWERAYMYIRKAGTIILTFTIIIWFLMSFPRSIKTDGTGTAMPNRQTDIGHTYAGQFGKLIEPTLKPLGFDWRIGVALTAGFAAKEVVVSTLATIYSIGAEDNEQHTRQSLQHALQRDPMMNRVKAYGLMLFILIYVPCVAFLSVMKRESGSMKWVALMVVYTITLAWTISFTFIRIASFAVQ
jgi:ferrous iron transport protein B